jgi:SAM-dependent methyltransferase
MQCKFCCFPFCDVKKQIVSPHNHLLYSLYRCPTCKCYFFDLHEHDVVLKNLYEDASHTRGSFPEEFVPRKSWQQQVSLLTGLLGRQPGSVLDIGCRTGDFLMHFSSSVYKEGIELSSHFAGIARNRGLRVNNEFVEKIIFTQSYDLVACFAILEHMENPLLLLDKMPEIVSGQGIFGILIPMRQSLKRSYLDLLGRHWHMYTPPEHLNFFSRTYLDQYLEKMGFRLIHRYYSSGGMVNIAPGVPMFNKMITFTIESAENLFLKSFPVFDHMYSYYINKGKPKADE